MDHSRDIPPPRPSQDLYEDLGWSESDVEGSDFGRTRSIVPVVLIGAFAVLLLLVVSFAWSGMARQSQEEENVLEAYRDLETQVNNASPGGLLRLNSSWVSLDDRFSRIDSSSRRFADLEEARALAGAALWDRALHYLESPAALQRRDHITLVRILLGLKDEPALAERRSEEFPLVEDLRNAVVSGTIDEIGVLAGDDASVPSLEEASLLARELSSIAPQDLRAELEETARVLSGRASRLAEAQEARREQGAAAMDPRELMGPSADRDGSPVEGEGVRPDPEDAEPSASIPEDSPKHRRELVDLLSRTLDPDDTDMSLALEGDNAERLVIRGGFPASVLRGFFDNTPDLWRRLDDSGFESVEFQGDDDTVTESVGDDSGASP